MVPKNGIEPLTRSSSGFRSTTELLRQKEPSIYWTSNCGVGSPTRYNPLRLVPQGGIEPPTSALPKRRSTPELLRLAPEARVELATIPLTAGCSTIELLGNLRPGQGSNVWPSLYPHALIGRLRARALRMVHRICPHRLGALALLASLRSFESGIADLRAKQCGKRDAWSCFNSSAMPRHDKDAYRDNADIRCSCLNRKGFMLDSSRS